MLSQIDIGFKCKHCQWPINQVLSVGLTLKFRLPCIKSNLYPLLIFIFTMFSNECVSYCVQARAKKFRKMGSTTAEEVLDIDPIRVGRPRLEPYQRLLSRFYEPLFLLDSLGQTRGSHTAPSFNFNPRREQSRRFLQNLCSISDFRKGGSTCTAIGLEELDTSHIFWVASNRETDQIVAFLRTALGALRAIAHPTGTADACTDSEFGRMCIEIAAERIEAEKRCLRKFANDCLSILEKENAVSELVAWLQIIIRLDDHSELCRFAYRHRHKVYVRELRRRASKEEKQSSPTKLRSPFILVRHYIGRLAHHIRSSKALIEDSKDLSHLLDNHAICPIHAPSAVPPPIRDSHTNLRGILNRMFHQNSEEKNMLKDGLLHLNNVVGIFDTFLRHYDGSALEVHAEIQVLEYFWKMRKPFAGDDRFIACSKPACLCCELYFRYHPARVMLSSSHRKIWTKWSPPYVERFDHKSPAARQQRDILNKMTQALRVQVSDHVIHFLPSKRWHPDSITNITDTRRSSLCFDLLDVSDADDPETPSSINLQCLQHKSTSSSNMKVPGSVETEANLDEVFDSEDGGTSLSGST
ncbi:unnamed protein product [Penicillium salamii]|nr:unnamed protein product [Penicillium salamii]CAG8313808.1 unnamed protein product [Penicillium salamii]